MKNQCYILQKLELSSLNFLQKMHRLSLLVPLIIIEIVHSQVDFIDYADMSPYMAPSLITAIHMNYNGSQVFISTNETIPKILRMNATNPADITRIGEYLSDNTTSAYQFYSIFTVKDYLIASTSFQTPTKVFNLTTYQIIGQFNINTEIVSLKYVQSRDLIIFGSTNGSTHFCQMSTFPNAICSTLLEDYGPFKTFVELSPDGTYISVVYDELGYLDIFSVSNFNLVAPLSFSSDGSVSHVWSLDSRYVIVFPYNESRIYEFDRNQNWMRRPKVVPHQGISLSFIYEQNNTIVCISDTSNLIFWMSWQDYIVTQITTPYAPKFGTVSGDKKTFGAYINGTPNSSFFKTFQNCTGNTFFDSTSRSCVVCDSNCAMCLNTTACSRCVTNYQAINGLCQVCGSNTLYNNTTYLCDDVSTFCTGDQYYSIPLSNCVQCQPNCVQCSSTTMCQFCVSGYMEVNGACQACDTGTFYNPSTLLCQNCIANCAQCTTATACQICGSGYMTVNGGCQACGTGTFYNSSTLLCENCTANCDSCSSSSSCTACSTNYVLVNSPTVMCTVVLSNQSTISNQSSPSNLSTISNNNNFSITNPSKSSISFYQKLMEITLQSKWFEVLNKVPGGRVIFSQIFSMFINIDHLWLYIYHKRNYHEFITKFLMTVNNVEEERWNAVNSEILHHKLKINLDNIKSRLNFKYDRSSWKFVEVQNKSTSFLDNTVRFFLINLPLAVVTFFFLRVFFLLSFNYQISVFFREYAFNLFFLYFLMEGNLESFTYYIMFDFLQLNGNGYFHKQMNLITLLLGFLFLSYLFAGKFLILILQKENSKYFFKDYQINLISLIFATIQNGIFNFALGSAHILAQNHYNQLLAYLMTIEFGYILVIALSMRSRKIHYQKYIGWQNVLASLLRIVLMASFYSDQILLTATQELFNETQMTIMVLYLVNWIFSILAGYFSLFIELIKYLKNKFYPVKLPQKQRSKTKNKLRGENSSFEKRYDQIFKRKKKSEAANSVKNQINLKQKHDLIKKIRKEGKLKEFLKVEPVSAQVYCPTQNKNQRVYANIFMSRKEKNYKLSVFKNCLIKKAVVDHKNQQNEPKLQKQKEMRLRGLFKQSIQKKLQKMGKIFRQQRNKSYFDTTQNYPTKAKNFIFVELKNQKKPSNNKHAKTQF